MFKKFAIASAVIAISASAAAANGSFGHLDGLNEGASTYEVNLIRSADAGVVSIETLTGDVLGTASVNAGANSNVLVPLQGSFEQDVVAKLIVNGSVADTQRIQVR